MTVDISKKPVFRGIHDTPIYRQCANTSTFLRKFKGRVDFSDWEFDANVSKKKRRAIAETIQQELETEGVYIDPRMIKRKLKVTLCLPLGKDNGTSVDTSFDVLDIIKHIIELYVCDDPNCLDDLTAILQSYLRYVERVKREIRKLEIENGEKKPS